MAINYPVVVGEAYTAIYNRTGRGQSNDIRFTTATALEVICYTLFRRFIIATGQGYLVGETGLIGPGQRKTGVCTTDITYQ